MKSQKNFSQPKKILIITNSLSGGGAERSMNLLANLFQTKNINTHLLALNKSKKDYVKLNCKVHLLNRINSGVNKFNPVFILKFLKLIRSINPSTVIINCALPEFFSIFLNNKIKKIIVEHHPRPYQRKIFLGIIIRFFLNFSTHEWVKVSHHFDLWRIKKPKTKVIENLLKVEKLNLHNKGEIKRLIFVGRLELQKNPMKALDVASQVRLPIVFIGSGSMQNKLYEESLNLNVESFFLGFVNNPWKFFKNGDLLIAPYISEGDGLVVAEAILQGLPLILNNSLDFRRFKLKPKLYCTSTIDYVTKIIENGKNIEFFCPNKNEIANLKKVRNPERIFELWQNLLI